MKVTKDYLKKLIMEELEKVDEALPRNLAMRAREKSKRIPGGGTLRIKNPPEQEKEKDYWYRSELQPITFDIVKLEKVVGSQGKNKSNLAYPGYYVVGPAGDMDGPFQSEEEAKNFGYKRYNRD